MIEYLLVSITAFLLILSLVSVMQVVGKIFPVVERVISRFDISDAPRPETTLAQAFDQARLIIALFLVSLFLLACFEVYSL